MPIFGLGNRAKAVDGEVIKMDGYAYVQDASQPGKLTVHLDRVPVDAPYWILALGGEEEVSRWIFGLENPMVARCIGLGIYGSVFDLKSK